METEPLVVPLCSSSGVIIRLKNHSRHTLFTVRTAVSQAIPENEAKEIFFR